MFPTRTQVSGRYSFSKTLVFDPPLLGPAIGDATNGGQLGKAPGLVQVVGLGMQPRIHSNSVGRLELRFHPPAVGVDI